MSNCAMGVPLLQPGSQQPNLDFIKSAPPCSSSHRCSLEVGLRPCPTDPIWPSYYGPTAIPVRFDATRALSCRLSESTARNHHEFKRRRLGGLASPQSGLMQTKQSN
jgi:hypothetical protein